MADPHASTDAYVRGEMKIAEQTSTFKLFIDLAKWGSLAVACLLVFLTLWFHPGGSFVVAAGATIVLAAVGVFVLKAKPAH